jgi:hypothetical protein
MTSALPRPLAFLLLLGVAVCTQAASPEPAALQARDPNSDEVQETASGLIWARCTEGMRWSGKHCLDRPLLLTRAEAMQRASERQRDSGLAWRLPTAKELQRLVKLNRQDEGLDPKLFPDAPLGWHWTSTTRANGQSVNAYRYDNIARGVSGESVNRLSFLQGWSVDVGTGEMNGEVAKKSQLPVRLVRNGR